MITKRLATDRGHADHGWLQTSHTFSFADYQDPRHMGFRALRVMNEDFIQPGRGFGTHGHRDMEIITYVLEGALEHKDSMGNGEVLRPGEFQRMSAGKGIRHSEFNPSATEPVHLYQIWLHPQTNGIEPSYEQKMFAESGKIGKFQLVASPDGDHGSLKIHQDVKIYLAKLAAEEAISFDMVPGRHAWLQVLRGKVALNGIDLNTSDGIAVSEEPRLNLVGQAAAEIMLFDLV